jgi:hypothetical protein
MHSSVAWLIRPGLVLLSVWALIFAWSFAKPGLADFLDRGFIGIDRDDLVGLFGASWCVFGAVAGFVAAYRWKPL